MSKAIKVIDLLNMISKGEELPKKIKIGDKEYHYCKSCKVYEDEKERDIRININEYCLNDEVEIIEEEPEIDIQGIDKRLKRLENMVDRFEYIEKRVEAIDSQNGIFRYC